MRSRAQDLYKVAQLAPLGSSPLPRPSLLANGTIVVAQPVGSEPMHQVLSARECIVALSERRTIETM